MRSEALAAAIIAAVFVTSLGATHGAPAIERARANDNREPAGVLRDGVLTLRIDARLGDWHPDNDSGPGVAVPAFAEPGRPPQIPGPLIRVPAGTTIALTLRNQLESDTLVVRGLHARPGTDAPVTLLPGESRTVSFPLDAPGTYYYWGTTTGRAFDFRIGHDGQLSGAIVVDEPGAPPPRDRVMVIGMWADTVGRAQTRRTRVLAVINGRSWPGTERLSYAVGDTVQWRVVNASADAHPMHLHGFYFRVDSRGDGMRDTTYRAGAGDRAVTSALVVGAPMRITWIPERPGNWLFHCHLPEHFERRGPLGVDVPAASASVGPDAHAHSANHAEDGMSGLVMGIHVRGTAGAARPSAPTAESARRRVRLLVRRNRGGTDSAPYFGFAIQEGPTEPRPDSGLRLGPPLVLVRDQPVSITVVNRLREPTAVHWHGIELESYYDGVAGFSGDGRRLAPLIAPRDSFEVRFTPPRAGTFIYHTHADETRQQPAGLAGPLIVVEPGTTYDPSTDRTVLFTTPWSLADQARAIMVNGSLTPTPLVLRAGTTYRLRFINMTTRRPAIRVELRRDSTLLAWRRLAKDGADLPSSRQVAGVARHEISIGETFDIELTPDTVGDMRLDMRIGGRTVNGPILGVLPIRVVR